MVFNRDEVVKRALASHTNVPDTCQLWTRTIIGAPSAGDFDGDGAADAEDGWKSEPAHAKHPGDRHPPAGVPVSYLGGSHDNGHRAISLGGGMIRSTDAGGRGVVATVRLDFPETHWGLTYAGWSETCDGVQIPLPPKPSPPPPKPQPKPGPTVTIVHRSGKVSHPAATAAQMTAALDADKAAGADVITLTEVGSPEMTAALAAWADANKWHLYHPPYAGQRECAILSRKPLVAAKAQPLSEVALPNGRAPLALVSARVKQGPWVAAWHSPAHTEGLKPGNPFTRIYRAALARLRVARMQLRGGGVVLAADWNLDLRRTTVRAQLAKPYPHMRWAWAPGQKATEGGRVIDGVLTNLDVAKPAVTLPAQPGFDHRAVLVVLRKKGKA